MVNVEHYVTLVMCSLSYYAFCYYGFPETQQIHIWHHHLNPHGQFFPILCSPFFHFLPLQSKYVLLIFHLHFPFSSKISIILLSELLFHFCVWQSMIYFHVTSVTCYPHAYVVPKHLESIMLTLLGTPFLNSVDRHINTSRSFCT